MENQFLDMDRYLQRVSGKKCRPRRVAKAAPGLVAGKGIASMQSSLWAQPLSATDRVLVILIENGGVDLGIPALVEKIFSSIPGSSMVPDNYREKLVNHVREKITGFTDQLLETAELSINRYAAAKPDHFGDVVVLRDGTSSYQDLKQTLLGLSRDGKIVDVFILTHGSDDFISVPGGVSSQKIRDMKAENGKPLSVRSVYMMNCVGSTLNQAWIDAGAKASAGSLRNNYLPEPTMYFFWQNWKEGQTFENAVTSAYRKTINLMKEAVVAFISALPIPGAGLLAAQIDFDNFEFVKDSAPVIQGQRTLTITSDDLTFSQSASSSLATTVLSPRVLRLLSAVQSDGEPRSAGVLSQQGVDLIKQFEGFRATMYNDPVGHCTIGYGTLLHTGNCDGRSAEEPYVSGVTEEKATQLLAEKAGDFQKVIDSSVMVPLNQNQYDALVSFVYNIGGAAFKKSTLLRLLNQGDYTSVPAEMKKWTKARQDGKVVDLPGLVKRRAAEAELFQKPGTATAQSRFSTAATHRFRFHSPSTVVRQQSRYSIAQNPAAAVIAGMAVSDAAQIGLAAVAIVQAQVAASQGSFSLSFDKAQRLLTNEARTQMPGAQSSKQSYSTRLLFLSIGAINSAEADVIIEWEGNAYGEIGTAMIRRNLSTSTDWSKSSANIVITKVDRIPLPATDPRTWPIVYNYEGTYDPYGNGHFEFSGEFEINAFGGLKFNRHEVVSRSLLDFAIGGTPEGKVAKGADIAVPVPTIPEEQIAYLRTKLP